MYTRSSEATGITVAFGVICVLAVLGTVFPVIELILNIVFGIAAGFILLGLAGYGVYTHTDWWLRIDDVLVPPAGTVEPGLIEQPTEQVLDADLFQVEQPAVRNESPR